MSKAKKMFKILGYEQDVKNREMIRYRKLTLHDFESTTESNIQDLSIVFKLHIIPSVEFKNYCGGNQYNFDRYDVHLHMAINQQMKELGWFDNE